MRKVFEIGGVIAAAVLTAVGIVTVVMGFNGQSTVNSSLKQEQIYGTSDMSPKGIANEVKSNKAAQTALFARLNEAGVKFNGLKPVPSQITTPSCTVASQFVDNGDRARCFAEYMRIHTFGATSGLTYSQMGLYVAKPGTPFKYTDGLGGTSDPMYAQLDAKTQQTVANGRRDLWVTYTALTTALNAGYMASQISLFGIVVGFALLLSGLGFGILAVGGALRSPDTAFGFVRKWGHKEAPTPVAPAA
jgi:hypothetical protein